MTTTENKMLRMTSEVTLRDKIKSTYIRNSLQIIQPIAEILRYKQLRWYDHIMRRDQQHLINEAKSNDVPRQKRRGRHKDTWIAQMRKRQTLYEITQEEVDDREIKKYSTTPTLRITQLWSHESEIYCIF